MSVTSSIEKPTTTAVQQQQQHQQQQESTAATTTTATIAIAAGQQQQQQQPQQQQPKRKSLNPKRSYSLSSSSASSSGSFGAIRSATSPLVSEQERKGSAGNNQQGQAFLPFNYCTDTVAAVHHQRQSYALVQKPPSLRYQGKPHTHTHNQTHSHHHHHQLLANFSPTMTSSEPSSPLAAEGSGSGILSPSEVTTHCCTNVKANITPLATQKMHRTIPSDKVSVVHLVNPPQKLQSSVIATPCPKCIVDAGNISQLTLELFYQHCYEIDLPNLIEGQAGSLCFFPLLLYLCFCTDNVEQIF